MSTINSTNNPRFSVGVGEFPAPEAQEPVPLNNNQNNNQNNILDSAGVHLAVGDGTSRNALDRGLISSVEKMSQLMLDYLPETRFTPVASGYVLDARRIDSQEGLSAFLLRELVVKQFGLMALTYGTSWLVQSVVLDPLGVEERDVDVSSGLSWVVNFAVKNACGPITPLDLHRSLVDNVSRLLISSAAANGVGEGIRGFAVELMSTWKDMKDILGSGKPELWMGEWMG